MKGIYQLVFKNGSVSEPYTDYFKAYKDAIDYSAANEDGCALYALSTGLSTMFFNGEMATNWIDYDKVQVWFADDDEEADTPRYSDTDTAIQVIDHVYPQDNRVIGDDELEVLLRDWLTEEQILVLYRNAEILKDYVSCVEFFDAEIQVHFSCGVYLGFMLY